MARDRRVPMLRVQSMNRAAVAVALVASSIATASPQAQPPAAPLIPNLAGKIQTVLGPMDPSALGQTLMHEHIFIEFQSPRPVPRRALDAEDAAQYEQPLTLATLSRTRFGRGVRGSNFLGDFDESFAEVMEFKKVGGQAIVDVSNIGLGRDPQALVRMANATGMSIVMGASWYTKSYHPLDMDQRTVEELTDVIVRDVTVGAQGTEIRSGIIGEVGIDGDPLTPNEIKVIRASARASRLTGAPLSFHRAGVGEERIKTLDVVASEGTNMASVVMGHSSSIAGDFALMKRILDRGVFIEFDYLGVIGGPGGILAPRNDRTVLNGIVKLIEAGYADRIVLGHDICTKPQLKKYGGTGFSYINEYFLPELKRLGVSDENIRKIMIDNPRRALTFGAPKPPAATASAAR
jgi:phosphotriesterase-related protein